MIFSQFFSLSVNTKKATANFNQGGVIRMAFYPEPWKKDLNQDVEIAEDMSAMEALDPPYEPEGNAHTSLFRRYWEKLLRQNR